SSQLWEGINELEFNEILEEEKRLLYVAKTRAKELLILSFSGQRKKDGDMRISKSSFADLIGSVFKIRIEDDNQEITSVLGFGIPIWNSKDDLTFKTGLDKEGAPEPHEIEEIAMSVQKYEAQSFPIGVVDEEPIIRQLGDELSALEVGALMHRFLQIWDFKKKSIRKTVRFALNEGYVVDDSLEEILIKLGEDFLSSDLLERIINADSYDREIPFYMEIDGMPERRKIDLMIKEGDRISLFDYKYTSKGKIEEKELSEYKSQLEVYGKAVEKHFGRYPKEKTLVLLPDIELISIF
ncbi:MAG: 3'-5' exonuclease, partial [Thermodesulfobacteriota bacterium]